MAAMLRPLAYPLTQSMALEGCAESAGRALACAFSSSDEFEAALIAERRAEGRYGPRKYRKRKLMIGAAIFAAAAAFLFLLS
jgi:hypothetical protein